MGRPSTFSEDVANEICERICCGESLAAICRGEDMPAMRTVMTWLREREAFQQNYTRAREEQGEADADIVSDIRDQVIAGTMDPAAARVAIDAAKWSAGKRQPKKYGDALQMKHSGAIGTFDASKYTDEQLEQLEAVLGPITAAVGDAGGGEGGEGSTGG